MAEDLPVSRPDPWQAVEWVHEYIGDTCIFPDDGNCVNVEHWYACRLDIDRARAAVEAEQARLWQELEGLRAAQAEEKCDKCGRMTPLRYIAIEIENGAPISDPSGFQWCVVCHAQRVLAFRTQERDEARQALEQAKRLQQMTLDNEVRWMQKHSELEAQLAALTRTHEAALALVETVMSELNEALCVGAFFDPEQFGAILKPGDNPIMRWRDRLAAALSRGKD